MDAYIVDTVRTPIGRAGKGSLSQVHPMDLLKPLYQTLDNRYALKENALVDDVILGCVTTIGAQGANIGKVSSLYAGLGEEVSGTTISRYCCSGLDAINMAAAQLISKQADIVIAGGVESLSHVPMFSDKGAWFSHKHVAKTTEFIHMSVAADLLANLYQYDRNQLDQLAALSWQRAMTNRETGRFQKILVPVPNEHGEVADDDPIREVSMAALADLPPLNDHPTMEEHIKLAQSKLKTPSDWKNLHTKGTAPSQVDAASLILMANEKGLRALGASPLAEIEGWQNASSDPVSMLTGHALASEKLLQRNHLKVDDIDLFEVNESFAASTLFYKNRLNVSEDKLNISGGAMTLGHPLGATGCLLTSRLIQDLKARSQTRGLVAIPGGAGVGVATQIRVFEG